MKMPGAKVQAGKGFLASGGEGDAVPIWGKYVYTFVYIYPLGNDHISHQKGHV